MLNRGKINKIYEGSVPEAIPFIMKQTMMSGKAESVDLLVDLMDKFLTSVPLFKLECDISEQAVITSFEALTGEKYIKRK